MYEYFFMILSGFADVERLIETNDNIFVVVINGSSLFSSSFFF